MDSGGSKPSWNLCLQWLQGLSPLSASTVWAPYALAKFPIPAWKRLATCLAFSILQLSLFQYKWCSTWFLCFQISRVLTFIASKFCQLKHSFTIFLLLYFVLYIMTVQKYIFFSVRAIDRTHNMYSLYTLQFINKIKTWSKHPKCQEVFMCCVRKVQ